MSEISAYHEAGHAFMAIFVRDRILLRRKYTRKFREGSFATTMIAEMSCVKRLIWE